MKDIEYLSLYLPYDLQLLQNCDHWHEPIPSRIVTMCGLYDNGLVSNIHYQENNNNGGSDYVDKFKPLLYPLSILTEEMGKWLESGYLKDSHTLKKYGLDGCYWFEDYLGEGQAMELPFIVFQEVLRRHGDVFNLIQQGEAIDKSKL